ncbi:conserved hypothetical protein [Talaromyces stipitatus ATCC 10500]|uniref:Diaminohydroxyphosphoribosylamino-pyrimidine deaminase n=1 Tax=Talaromyces stipitatus (strain ATCC 10500 / CBS 375.48 / QM 6759 / NRRL 1006) TaxID=441959 RepID=B8MC59_TALSN|nr:uncharacterized protein TSTA_122380 [Talaromyces stipitatus ATCC 10500]EED18505.1 conserved hypothetical protein [Talaromyces stipitatus ATCC 10500]
MSESLLNFLSSIGEEVVDAEEESFLLFSRTIPSNNLGFVNSRTTAIDLSIHNIDYTIRQSPTLLSSTRDGGTTGAVLWKITPLFASWISAVTTNPFWSGILGADTSVIELGCGISGLVALTLAPLVRKYVATDQEYVRRFFGMNIEENAHSVHSSSKRGSSKKGHRRENTKRSKSNNIQFIPLDWELDIPSNQTLHNTNNSDTDDGPGSENGFDIIISCDCIYNEALIPCFVRTCADICNLRSTQPEQVEPKNPTMAIIAQQQRSPDVFEAWLKESLKYFRVWRVEKFSSTVAGPEGDESGLGDGSGYVVHVLVLREGLRTAS